MSGRLSNKMLRGKKRRLEESGGFVTEVEVRSEEMDAVLEVLLKEGDVLMLSGALERISVKQKTEFEKASFLAKARRFGVQLQEVASKLTRQQASQHNSVMWPLTQDLTVKVFSLLGTQCLCQVAASCNMFNKFAMDPACYVDVDLTMQGASDYYASKVGNRTVNKLVRRAGHNLRSLKLGVLPLQNKTPAVSNSDAGGLMQSLPVDHSVTPNRVFPTSCVPLDRDYLTRGCLESLTANDGVAGALLTRLHLFNLEKMDSGYLCRAIAACPCLTDLEVVGLFGGHCNELRPLMECLGSHCPNLNRLCCQAKKPDWSQYARYPEETLVTKSCNQLIKGCSNISYLALRGYGVPDKRANILLKGLPKLTVVDFCGDRRLSGVFLRGIVGPGDQPSQLTTILLRDCQKLKEGEVERFLFMLISGECKSLRHLDISSKGGLAARDWFDKRLSPSTEQAILRLREERTALCLLAEFPDHNKSSSESSESDTSLDDSDDSGPHGPHQYGSDTSDSDDSDDSDNSDDSELHGSWGLAQDYIGNPDTDSDSDMASGDFPAYVSPY